MLHICLSRPLSQISLHGNTLLFCHQNLWLQLSPISSGFIEIMCNSGMKMLAGKWVIRKIHKCIQLWQIFLDVIFQIQLRGKFLKCQHERWLLNKVKFSRVKSITDNTDIGLTFFPDQGAYIILSVNPRGI